MSWRVDSPRSFSSRAEANEYLDGVVRTVAALPGVEAVGLSDVLPLGRNRTWGVRAKGVEYPPGQGPYVFPRMVDQHYLQAMTTFVPGVQRFAVLRGLPSLSPPSSCTSIEIGKS